MRGMGESVQFVGEAQGGSSLAVATSFESFVDAHQARLFGALCLMTGDRFEAEEISQEAFLRVLERWDRVAEMDEPVGYLFRVSMNVFRTRRRRLALALRRAAGTVPDPDVFQAVDDRATLLRGLADVSPDQRAALVVTALYGLSSEEAGRILGIRPSTVRARASRARASLRRAIGEDR
jgi:RNA polymerase sigma-70 factor, ECF subfamily